MASLSNEIAEIAAGVYEVQAPFGDRRLAVWLVAGEDGVCLVDAGVAGTVTGTVLPALAALGRRPADVRDVVVTHADVDHFGGLAEARTAFPHATLRASAADRPLIESWDRIVEDRYGWYRPHGLDYEPSVWDALPALAGARVGLDATVGPGDRVAGFEVLALPGHTAGHLGLWQPDTGVLLLSDALLADGVPDASGRLASPPPYVSAPDYRRTIATVGALGATQVRTAHFPAATEPAALVARSAAFVDRLEQSVLDELRAGSRTLGELWLRLVDALGPFPSLAVELARSIHSHLEDLAGRGMVRAVAGEPPRWVAR